MTFTRLRTGNFLSGSVASGTLGPGAITGFPAAASASDDDLVLIYDDDAAALRKMTRANFTSGITGDITAVTAGTGLTGGGDTGDVTLAINDSAVATLTGSVFTGDVVFQSGLSGSLQVLSDGVTPYLTGAGGISITTASNGQITISGSTDTFASPGTPDKSVQFNSSGVFTGDSDFLYDDTSNTLTLSGTVQQLTSSIYSTDFAGSVSLVAASDLPDDIIFRLPENVGTKFELLQTDGAGNLSFDYADRVHIQVRNNSGVDLDAGTPVYVTGYNAGGDRAYIAASSASNGPTMPAAGLLSSDLVNNDNGHAALIGFLEGVDTSLFSVGETLYVATGGGLTNSKPTGANDLIQNVGFVLKAANSGIIYVTSPGRTNDVPNNLIGRAGLSGSLTRLVDGTSYLVAGANVSITSESNGQVTISSTALGTPGGSDTQLQFNDGGSFGGISGATTDGSAVTFGDSGILVGQDITHAGDADTKIVFADDAIGITVGGEQLLTISEAGTDMVTVGDGGDVDFRVRTNNDDNTLYIEGSTDRIGVGTNSPSSILHIKEAAPTLTLQRENNSNASTINFIGASANTANSIIHDSSTNDLVFKTFNGSTVEEILRIGDHYGVSNRQVIILSGTTMHAAAMHPSRSTDIAFFVSGAIGSVDTTNKGAAVFGGDTFVSGVLFADQGLSAFGSIKIDQNSTDANPQMHIHEDDSEYARISFTNNADSNGSIAGSSHEWTLAGKSAAQNSASDAQFNIFYGDAQGSGNGLDLFSVLGNGDGILKGTLALNCYQEDGSTSKTDPSLRVGHSHIYSKVVSGHAEVFVKDSNGNVTQISPHNGEGEWQYFSRNTKTGKVVRVNMEKMIRKLEEITGESFMEEWYEDPAD